MIPDTFHGLPVHALAVHGAVVFVPLSALLAILFVIPRTRAWAALPMLIVTVVALGNVFVARASGFNLRNDLAKFNPQIVATVQDHLNKANVLFYVMIVFTIVVIVSYLLYRQRDRFVGGLQYAVCGLLVVGALAVAFQTYRVGEAGSKAVWGGTVSSSTGSVTSVGR